jgi:hypothetical protein
MFFVVAFILSGIHIVFLIRNIKKPAESSSDDSYTEGLNKVQEKYFDSASKILKKAVGED